MERAGDSWLGVPREWLDSFGEIARFGAPGRRHGLLGPRLPLLRREPAPGRDPDPRLGADHLVLRLRLRPAVRHPRRLPAARPRGARLRRCLLRLVRPARGDALRLRLHARGQGRDRDRRRARRDADLRRDRRDGGDGDPADHLPLRDAAARRLDRPAVHLPGRNRRHVRGQLHLRRPADRRCVLGRLRTDLLDVPEPARPDLQPDQRHVHGDRDRAGRLLLRLHGDAVGRSASAPRRRSRWSSTSSSSTSSGCWGR